MRMWLESGAAESFQMPFMIERNHRKCHDFSLRISAVVKEGYEVMFEDDTNDDGDLQRCASSSP